MPACGETTWGSSHTTDAIYQPLVARQVLNSRHWDIQTAKNDALLQTADAYFMVHQYRGIYASTLYTVERGRDLVERIAALSRDLVPGVRGRPGPEHARRPRAAGRLGAAAVAGPERRLTKVLRLDPRAVVEPLEHDHVQITLIDPGRVLDDLMPIALTNRPEVASRRALVAGGGGRRSAGRRRARSSPSSRSTASRPPSRCSRPGSSASAPTAA